jgi:hypothetical protein
VPNWESAIQNWLILAGTVSQNSIQVLVLQREKSGHGGEGGIRTLDTLARIPVFETGLFNHSSTSPDGGSNAGYSRSMVNKALDLLFYE